MALHCTRQSSYWILGKISARSGEALEQAGQESFAVTKPGGSQEKDSCGSGECR